MRPKTCFRTAILGALALLVVACTNAQAGLVLETLSSGANVIFDPTNGTTWTQEGNISGTTFTQAGAENWAATLNQTDAALSQYLWRLPTVAEFSSLYGQLDVDSMTGFKFGTSVNFSDGGGTANHVQPEYWTSDPSAALGQGEDFNFFYGYGGSKDVTSDYSAWAVMVPEPSSFVLMIFGAAGIGVLRLRRSKTTAASLGDGHHAS